jgi:hypothetical protein
MTGKGINRTVPFTVQTQTASAQSSTTVKPFYPASIKTATPQTHGMAKTEKSSPRLAATLS